MPTRKSSLFAAGAAALFLCACPTIGHATPPPAELGAARVLQRDTDAGGPAGVALDELGPLFASDDLNGALRALDDGSGARAADALDEWLAENPSSDLRPAALFAHGYALYTERRWQEALPVLAACSDNAPLYADYCNFWLADAALQTDDPTTAASYADQVDADAVFGPRARYLRGRALIAQEAFDEAATVLAAFALRYPGAWYIDDVRFSLAEAYEGAGDNEQAAEVYHYLALVNPNSDVETRARAALAALLGEGVAARSADERTASEEVERARVLFNRHRSEQVIDMLSPLLDGMAAGTAPYCDAHYLVGKSYSKLRQHRDSIPHYAMVVEHCADEDLVVKALYNAGRGAWNVDEDEEALRWFERLYTEHTNNSYADDAVLLSARVHRSNDATDAYVALLNRQIEEFPQGDMLKDAVWLLASRHYTSGDYRGLVAFVDELGSRTGENDIYSRGRLAYYRARSLEHLSMQNEAMGQYVEVVRDNPMAFYALLAVNRLNDIAPERAQALVDELAAATTTESVIEVRPEEAARDGHFLRGRAMLRMGLYELAEGEFGKLRAKYANEDEIGWVVSLMYHHAGAYQRSHHVPGDRLDLRLAYPAPGNHERWEVAYPTPFEDAVMEAAEERDLDPFWVYAIMREESGFRPEIESWANARGLLQLMEGTANDMAELTGRGSVRTSQLFDPEINIELGTMFMRTLADRFASHPCLIFAGYNGGHGNVNSWLRARGNLPLDLWVEEIPYAQTRHYVKRVTMTWWVYHWMSGHRLPDLAWDLSDM